MLFLSSPLKINKNLSQHPPIKTIYRIDSTPELWKDKISASLIQVLKPKYTISNLEGKQQVISSYKVSLKPRTS